MNDSFESAFSWMNNAESTVASFVVATTLMTEFHSDEGHQQQTLMATTAVSPQQQQRQWPAQVMRYYNETKEFERKVGIIIPSIFAIVILVGLVGNLLVILVMALNRQMRNSTNTLIIGLTCSDLMFLTLCVPFTAIDYAFPVWVLPYWSCNVINYLQHASAYFSVWTLTLMAGDRFLAVCFPVESMTLRTPRNTMFVLAGVYSIILLTQIQVGRVHGVQEYTFIMEERSACSIISITSGEASVTEARLYFFSFNIFGYVIPLGITCVFYYFMLRRLWYLPKSMNGSANSGGWSKLNTASATAAPAEKSSTGASCLHAQSPSPISNNNPKMSTLQPPNAIMKFRPETIKAKKKVTRLVLCVVIIWALCWLPLNICFFFSGMVYPDTLVMRGGKPAVIAQISSQVLAYTNSCLNPILYPLVSENFRKGFLQVIGVFVYFITFGRCCRKMKCTNSRVEVTFCRSGSNSHRISRTNSQITSSQKKETTTGNNTLATQSNSIVQQEISTVNTESFGNGSAILQKFGIGANARRRSSHQFRRPSTAPIELEHSSVEGACSYRSTNRLKNSSSPGGMSKAETIDFPLSGRCGSGAAIEQRKRRLKTIGGRFHAERSTVLEEPTLISMSSAEEAAQMAMECARTLAKRIDSNNSGREDSRKSSKESWSWRTNKNKSPQRLKCTENSTTKSNKRLAKSSTVERLVMPKISKKLRSFSLLGGNKNESKLVKLSTNEDFVLIRTQAESRDGTLREESLKENSSSLIIEPCHPTMIDRLESSSCDEKNDITV